MDKNREPISQDVIDIVIARLESMPRNVQISIGNLGTTGGSYTIDELIDRVRKQDDIGRTMVDVQMSYIQSLTKLASPA